MSGSDAGLGVLVSAWGVSSGWTGVSGSVGVVGAVAVADTFPDGLGVFPVGALSAGAISS